MTERAVLFVSGTPGDTRRYRCDHQQAQLRLLGIQNTLKLDDDSTILGDVALHDVIILHRVPFSPLIADFLALTEFAHKPVLFETDDLIFDPEAAGQVPLLDTMTATEARRYRQVLRGYEATFQRCRHVLVPTEYLAEAARRFGKQAFVNRNVLSDELLRISEEAQRNRHRSPDDDRVIIGYFSGSGSHDRDFRAITDVLVKVMRAHPHVWLHVAGELNLSYKFDPLLDRVVRTPYLPWRELPHVIAQTDINIVPLQTESPFCRAKSELKYFEAGAVAVPTVASPTDAYRWAITDGENGLLAQTPDDWERALHELIGDPERRHALGQAALQDVYRRYTPESCSSEFGDMLQTLLADAPPAPPAALLAEQIIARLLRHITRQQDVIEKQQSQVEGLRQMSAQQEEAFAAFQRSIHHEMEQVLAQLAALQ